jgi:hypothetical protein
LKLTGHLPLGGNLIDLSKRLNQQVLWLQSEPYTGNQQRQNNQRDYGISPIPLEREAGGAGEHADHRRGNQDEKSKLNYVEWVQAECAPRYAVNARKRRRLGVKLAIIGDILAMTREKRNASCQHQCG